MMKVLVDCGGHQAIFDLPHSQLEVSDYLLSVGFRNPYADLVLNEMDTPDGVQVKLIAETSIDNYLQSLFPEDARFSTVNTVCDLFYQLPIEQQIDLTHRMADGHIGDDKDLLIAIKNIKTVQSNDLSEDYAVAMEAGGKQFILDILTQPDMNEQKTQGGKSSMHRFQFGEALQRQKESLNRMYPPGTRIELNFLCNDERDMPPGLRGTVTGIDDQPALLMRWDNGRGLSIFPDEDDFRKLTSEELAEEKAELREEGGINLA